MAELTDDEKQVMMVYRRCTGFFSKKPKPNSQRRSDQIWRSMQAEDVEMELDSIAAAIKGCVDKGLLSLDDSDITTLTDEGHALISQWPL